jgi:probable non-F420 flavinoid oxidoreductase
MAAREIAIGYHASHEQFAPSELIKYTVLAEAAGFHFVMSADHLNPWSTNQGHSGFAWSWLGSALQATKQIKFGSIAIPCGWRYHPVIVAQAAATLAQMHPGRFEWIAVGSGEALNEKVVSPDWPEKRERNERLKEGIEIIRRLWNNEEVTKVDGYHYTNSARIWSLPLIPPVVLGAAIGPQTAAYLADIVDGLVTVYQPEAVLKEMIRPFRAGNNGSKKLYVQIHISWHVDEEQARRNAFDQWRSNLVPPVLGENLASPESFRKIGDRLSIDSLEGQVFTGSSPGYFIELIDGCFRLGFDGVVVHNTGRNQEAFLHFFGEKVLPYFRDKGKLKYC